MSRVPPKCDDCGAYVYHPEYHRCVRHAEVEARIVKAIVAWVDDLAENGHGCIAMAKSNVLAGLKAGDWRKGAT